MTSQNTILQNTDQQLSTVTQQSPIQAQGQQQEQKYDIASTMSKSLNIKGVEMGGVVNAVSKNILDSKRSIKENPYLITPALDNFENKLSEKRKHYS